MAGRQGGHPGTARRARELTQFAPIGPTKGFQSAGRRGIVHGISFADIARVSG